MKSEFVGIPDGGSHLICGKAEDFIRECEDFIVQRTITLKDVSCNFLFCLALTNNHVQELALAKQELTRVFWGYACGITVSGRQAKSLREPLAA